MDLKVRLSNYLLIKRSQFSQFQLFLKEKRYNVYLPRCEEIFDAPIYLQKMRSKPEFLALVSAEF
ncbi:hypothetical protein C7B69_06485 [filamentous cyanobacterium Phorm 46]|nr:hypothetical protein C7B69_06485 [filamentous cyanobacterium Phorm 46]